MAIYERIAEQIIIAGQNVPKVYDAGYAEGYTKGTTDGYEKGSFDGYNTGRSEGYDNGRTAGYADGKEAGILEGIEQGKEQGYSNGYSEGEAFGMQQGRAEGYDMGIADGIEQGKQAEYDAFWDVYQANGTRRFYSYAFAYVWGGDVYSPKYDICGGNSNALSYLFYISQATDTKVNIDATLATGSASVFHAASKLKTIRKIIISQNTTFGSWFNDCTELENLTIEGVIGKDGFNVKWSKKLSRASHESIMAALSTTTTGLTVTFSQTAVNNAFATAEGAADGSTSAEWLALAATRTNWTISLA